MTLSAATIGGKEFTSIFVVTAEDVSRVWLGNVGESLCDLHYTLSLLVDPSIV